MTDSPQSREVIERTLGAAMGRIVSNFQALPAFAEKHAGELGLDFLGNMEERPDAPVLRFPTDRLMKVQWDQVQQQLVEAIGKPTSLFAVVRQGLVGIRGTKGDIMLRCLDITIYRHYGTFQTLAAMNGRVWEPPKS